MPEDGAGTSRNVVVASRPRPARSSPRSSMRIPSTAVASRADRPALHNSGAEVQPEVQRALNPLQGIIEPVLAQVILLGSGRGASVALIGALWRTVRILAG